MPIRPNNSNKGTFGKILNIAGSKYMPGAAYLSSISALKVGAGYVELASNEGTLQTIAKLAPEIVLIPLSDIKNVIKGADVISIGCGLTISKDSSEIFKYVVKNTNNHPLIIDADGLNILSNNYVKLNKKTVLTPHPKEASRLLNCDIKEILTDAKKAAVEISNKYNCVTVLKTHNTIVTDGNICYINKTGCSALSKAGTGDVLCGIISGLTAQKLNIFDSAALGVYLHGLAGNIAVKDLTEYGVLASDLVRYIPIAIKSYLGNTI